MAACRHCGEQNSERARFCQGCGQAVAAPGCPGCGEENAPGARFCQGCGQPLAGSGAPGGKPPAAVAEAAEQARKTVTLVFSDVTGSTAMAERLDPEVVRSVMSRYFARMRAILESHGGTVEKFIGDAVMAVFGIPAVHEDDALRAVRAVAEIRRELGALGEQLQSELGVSLRFRTGVNTGEVIAGDASAGQAFATGDTVNLAARLEQAAPPGEALLGEATYRLVRHAVRAEPVEPLTLKGKSKPVPAWRLVEFIDSEPGADRGREARFVGRATELAALGSALAGTLAGQGGGLVTVLGDAGMGKSRLVEQFVSGLDGSARVIEGRCLSYGAGITYWPVQVAIRQAAGIVISDSPEEACLKLEALLPLGEEGDLVARRVEQVLGLAEGAAPVQEVFWGIRKLLEALAASRPLVLILDDLHWAEPALLDLIEYLLGWSAAAPVLLVCLARGDLLDARPGWGAGVARGVTVDLAPLSEADTVALMESILGPVPPATRRRVLEAAEGNPLYAQEVLRFLIDDGHLVRAADGWEEAADLSQAVIPPTVGQLVAARLDRLEHEERSVLQRASVVGKVFWWGAVTDLSPSSARTGVASRLQVLVRKELVRPHRGSTFAGEDEFAFSHIMVKDIAYQGASKEVRADLHQRFSDWIRSRAEGRVTEYEEILGYHLEQAHRLLSDLGPTGERGRLLAERAAGHLAAAGGRALARGDVRAAANLLERAAALWPEDDPRRVEMLPELGRAVLRTGDFDKAAGLFVEAIERARAAGDRRLEARALVQQSRLRIFTDPDMAYTPAREAADEAVAVFDAAGDRLGLARAYEFLGLVSTWSGQEGAAGAAYRSALDHERAVDGVEQARLLGAVAWVGACGPSPAAEVIALCDELAPVARPFHGARADLAVSRAWMVAMQGRFDEARDLLTEAAALLADLGQDPPMAAYAPLLQSWARVESLAGDDEEAVARLELECSTNLAGGNQAMVANSGGLLARCLFSLGRFAEADRWARTSEEAAGGDDLYSQATWRAVRARLLARDGRAAEAEALGREAVALTRRTDALILQADTLADLAEVLRVSGQATPAEGVAGQALALYRAKGDLISVKKGEDGRA